MRKLRLTLLIPSLVYQIAFAGQMCNSPGYYYNSQSLCPPGCPTSDYFQATGNMCPPNYGDCVNYYQCLFNASSDAGLAAAVARLPQDLTVVPQYNLDVDASAHTIRQMNTTTPPPQTVIQQAAPVDQPMAQDTQPVTAPAPVNNGGGISVSPPQSSRNINRHF